MAIPAKSRIMEDIVRRLRFKVSGKLLLFLLAQGHDNISLNSLIHKRDSLSLNRFNFNVLMGESFRPLL